MILEWRDKFAKRTAVSPHSCDGSWGQPTLVANPRRHDGTAMLRKSSQARIHIPRVSLLTLAVLGTRQRSLMRPFDRIQAYGDLPDAAPPLFRRIWRHRRQTVSCVRRGPRTNRVAFAAELSDQRRESTEYPRSSYVRGKPIDPRIQRAQRLS